MAIADKDTIDDYKVKGLLLPVAIVLFILMGYMAHLFVLWCERRFTEEELWAFGDWIISIEGYIKAVFVIILVLLAAILLTLRIRKGTCNE